ncbi:DNA replication ATP-dependent helicase/nuclease DNA2 [Labeo rohita]|uniref:DNA replication ATP-dependent helicase/nuclease DNA2 n=1 Tax=Labeo rohita TaxID=84645 RepID=A0ABQ8MLA8_LABRO|nr:DNA replication ATP-dependent helicase/nuclease DNA2 [Labeo rohita]
MVSQFGSQGYTIMGKTADLTVVQKTIIDTLHKEGKTQTFIAKEAGCSQSAVSKHVNRKMSGRKKCGRKRCTTNRENHSLEGFVKQNRFKPLLNHRQCQRRRRNGLLPSGPKSSFQMRASFVFVFHLETKVLESGGRVEKLIAQVA